MKRILSTVLLSSVILTGFPGVVLAEEINKPDMYKVSDCEGYYCFSSNGVNPDDARFFSDCLSVTKVQCSFVETVLGEDYYYYEAIHSYESAEQ
ncbi:MAG: hypothetical protein K6F79_07010 [Saccharofermentans sp.]|nr:hypothetical protein [Saccharofermentans sp.]